MCYVAAFLFCLTVVLPIITVGNQLLLLRRIMLCRLVYYLMVTCGLNIQKFCWVGLLCPKWQTSQ